MGDMFFQLIAFSLLLFIPGVIALVYIISKGRNARIERLEQKVDQLLAEKDK